MPGRLHRNPQRNTNRQRGRPGTHRERKFANSYARRNRSSRHGHSPFGRGRLAFGRSRLLPPQRRVVVKARVVRHQGRAFRSAPLSAHVAYLERDGVTSQVCRESCRANLDLGVRKAQINQSHHLVLEIFDIAAGVQIVAGCIDGDARRHATAPADFSRNEGVQGRATIFAAACRIAMSSVPTATHLTMAAVGNSPGHCGSAVPWPISGFNGYGGRR
jgi:hypothetical protein